MSLLAAAAACSAAATPPPPALPACAAAYDPYDMSTLFQDSAGTTPVTTDGDPVGLWLDKSGNGQHWRQTDNSKRPTFRSSGGFNWVEVASGQWLEGQVDGLKLGKAGICIAFRQTSGVSAYAHIFGIPVSAGNANSVWSFYSPAGSSGTYGYHHFGVWNANFTAACVVDNDVTVFIGYNDCWSAYSSAQVSKLQRIDGVEKVGFIGAVGSDQTYANSGQRPMLGSNVTSGGNQFVGRIYGMIIPPDAAITSQPTIDALEAWVNERRPP